MLLIRPSRLTILLDRLTGRDLLVAAALLTLFSAFGYWILSKALPGHGLVLPDGLTQVSPFDALYFSITTETTLGYGDIRPAGMSRLLACVQVICGLILGGIAVAKITSLSGRELRLVSHQASGDWIEISRMPDGSVIISLSIIYTADGVLRYEGENYDQTGEPRGFFKGELIDANGSLLRFQYSNRDSEMTLWCGGIASVQFIADSKSEKWVRLHGTAHDIGFKRDTTYDGVRASEEESSIIHGTDCEARRRLVRRYAEQLSMNPKPINNTQPKTLRAVGGKKKRPK